MLTKLKQWFCKKPTRYHYYVIYGFSCAMSTAFINTPSEINSKGSIEELTKAIKDSRPDILGDIIIISFVRIKAK